jgi:hypothetical protein
MPRPFGAHRTRDLFRAASLHKPTSGSASPITRAFHRPRLALYDIANGAFPPWSKPGCRTEKRSRKHCPLGFSFNEFPLAIPRSSRMYRRVDALARAYGPWWLCNDVTRPFWQSGLSSFYGAPGPEREVDMVAVPTRAIVPCPDAVLPGTRQRGRGSRVTDPSSLS